MESVTASKSGQNNTVGTKKLGFGLVGSGKSTVPSLFHEEEDEDAQKDKKMRPLVPIDYSTEELQAVRETTPVAPFSNLAAAADFAKRIGHANTKEERPDSERERSRLSHDKANEMLERLQSILDDEAEMFVLKMWRMLIFEVKKVETGLAGRAKA